MRTWRLLAPWSPAIHHCRHYCSAPILLGIHPILSLAQQQLRMRSWIWIQIDLVVRKALVAHIPVQSNNFPNNHWLLTPSLKYVGRRRISVHGRREQQSDRIQRFVRPDAFYLAVYRRSRIPYNVHVVHTATKWWLFGCCPQLCTEQDDRDDIHSEVRVSANEKFLVKDDLHGQVG